MIDAPSTRFSPLSPMHDADSGPLPQQSIGEIRVGQRARQVWLADASSPLHCGPDPRLYHRLQDVLTWNDGGFRCSQKMQGGGQCDRLVYILGGNFRVGQDDRRVFLAANVTPEEMRFMREQHMLYQQALAYLGIGLLP